jgi:hypothetical protein
MPKYLYKYQSFTVESITNLKNRQLWFSKPSSFNDPYDCAIRPDANISDKEYELIFLSWQKRANYSEKKLLYKRCMENGKLNQTFKDDVKRAISDTFESYRQILLSERGVTCFSEKNDDVLMWSHYAQGHKGFCLEFETSAILFQNVFPVRYCKTIPIANPASIFLAETKEEQLEILDDWSSGWMQMLTTKADFWAYEKEWRLFHKEGNKLRIYGTDCLTGIYFGVAMDYSHKEIISMILQGSSTKLYEMKKSDGEFRLTYEPVEYIPYSYAKDKS